MIAVISTIAFVVATAVGGLGLGVDSRPGFNEAQPLA